MRKITVHLWRDREARQAAELYAALLPDGRVASTTTLRGTPSGDTDVVEFELGGQPFVAISAGPMFRPNPSISFHLKFATAAGVDRAWAQLSPGGKALMPLDRYPFSPRFGWIEDRYGFSWQVLQSDDPGQAVSPAMLFTGGVCGRAEEAMALYTRVFQSPPAEVLARYGEGEAPDRAGTVKFARFTLRGQEFAAMDSAAPHAFAFNEAVSLMAPCDTCDTQAEIDTFWAVLAADPNAGQCGWLKDPFGVSWQITPAALAEMLRGDAGQRERVTRAFLKMKKFDLAELQRAYAGRRGHP